MITTFRQNSPINRKLIRTNLLVTGAALLVPSAAFLFFELAAFRETMVRNLSIWAQIAGASSAYALVSDDSGSASRTLAALKASPYVLFVGIYTRDGKLFASYSPSKDSGSKDRATPPLPRLAPHRTEDHRFTSGDLSLVHEIFFRGKLVGSIYIRTGLRELNDQVLRCLGVFGFVLSVSLFAAFALSGIQARDAALESAHERLNLALKSAGIGTWSVAENHISWDDFMYPLFGVEPGTFSGSYEALLDLIHPNDRQTIRRAVEDSTIRDGRENDFHDIEFRAIMPDGELHTLTARGKVYCDDSCQPVRISGVCWMNRAGQQLIGLEERDITGRKHLEEQLRQAQRLESVGQFAGGVAHDLNNLLTVIIGYDEVMLSELPPGDRKREFIDEIHQAAQRASGLTRQLQAFSQRQTSEPKIVRISDLIAGIEKMLRRLIGQQIDMKVTLDDNAGCLRADPGHIEQVIMNLVINARDAMPAGGKLTLETSHFFVDEDFARMHLGTTPGDNIMLSVTDTGMGISREIKARIFEPFFTTREKGQGAGLGLSTVYGIVKQNGGFIWVYSEPGMGAVFKVLFPRFADPEEATDSGRSAAEEPLSGNETILIAEDEPVVRRYVRQILVRNGYTVLEASEGNEAMEIIGENHAPIHLLLTDVVMPDTGGVELAEYFSRMHPGVPFMYMSGYKEQLWFREDVPVNLLQKPFTAAALLKRIRDLLDRPAKLAMTQGAA